MDVLGYLPKLNRGLGLAFGKHFLHDFSIKILLFNTLSTEKVSITCLFSFPIYQTKCVSKFLFSQLMSQTIRFMLDQPLKQMADRKKKRGRWKYKNLNISRMKIAF